MLDKYFYVAKWMLIITSGLLFITNIIGTIIGSVSTEIYTSKLSALHLLLIISSMTIVLIATALIFLAKYLKLMNWKNDLNLGMGLSDIILGTTIVFGTITPISKYEFTPFLLTLILLFSTHIFRIIQFALKKKTAFYANNTLLAIGNVGISSISVTGLYILTTTF